MGALMSNKLIMKFQQQQKGLFTFYKQQQLFEQQIAISKHIATQKPPAYRNPNLHNPTPTLHNPTPTLHTPTPTLHNPKPNEYTYTSKPNQHSPKLNEHNPKVNSEGDAARTTSKLKIDSQPAAKVEKTNQAQKMESAFKFKKVGQAVVVFNRKEAEPIKPTELKYLGSSIQSTTKEQGTSFIQHKILPSDSLLRQSRKQRQTLNRRKILFPKRREESVLSSKRYEMEQASKQYQLQDHPNRLPTLGKETSRNSQPSAHLRNKISGSLIKSNGSDLLRQIRSNALQDSSDHRDPAKRSVSYIEYNRDYYHDTEDRKKDKLSLEQKKILQILSRYRRHDYF